MFIFPTAVQVERAPYSTNEHYVSRKRIGSTTSVQQSPTTLRNVGTVGMPFPFYSFGSTPFNMVNTLFNNDAKNHAISTSMMIEILSKAEEAEMNMTFLPSPGLVGKCQKT